VSQTPARGESRRPALEALLTFDPVTPLRAYSGPKLSIVTRFNETPAALHALVPAVGHRKLDGVGHWLQLDAPDRVNAEIEGFLGALPEASPGKPA
jgi:pimeloyl-ACP methyl ester carboxylesterase